MKRILFITLVVVFVTTSCSTQKRCRNYHDCLAGTSWMLTKIVSSDSEIIVSEDVPELNFTANEVNGTTGCNHFFGSYAVRGESVKITLKGSTKMMCPNMTIEDAMLTGLDHVTTAELSDDQLELKGATLSFYFVRK